MKKRGDINLSDKWLAGFFDGEGWLGIFKQIKKYTLMIQIGQRKRNVLEKIKEFLGYGSISINKNRVPCFACYGQNAAELLRRLLPYLQVKTLQVRYALQFQKYKKYERPLSEKEIRFREMHKRLISLVNHL